MERSGTQLLDLWFDLASVHSSWLNMRYNMLQDGVDSRFFSIQMLQWRDFYCACHAPNFEYLAIHPHDFENEIREETEIDSDLLSIPSILPGILKLSSFWFDISAVPSFLSPLSNITILCIDSSGFRQTIEIDMTAFLSILAIPGLEHLSLSGDIIKYDDSTVSVIVPHLKHLQIVGAYTTGELLRVQLLQVIDAPFLDVLVLERITIHAINNRAWDCNAFPGAPDSGSIGG